MAKPIFIFYPPKSMREEQVINARKVLEKRLNDYHVLVVMNIDTDKNFKNFEVFYEKDFNHVKFGELKDILSKGGPEI